jgi:Mg/Co/Ni transporter MgtE
VPARTAARNGDVFIVVNDEGVVLGRLRGDALDGDPEASVEQVMESGPVTFRPSVPLEEMADYMQEHGMDSALITTTEGRLVGIL